MTDDCLLLFLYKCLDFKGISQVNFLQPGGQSNYEEITDKSIADTGNLSGHVSVTLKENSSETILYQSRCNRLLHRHRNNIVSTQYAHLVVVTVQIDQ